ncbi:helix-turn-helix transcriptional regulator [Cryobacterium sp. Y11]|uniref:helix-turn-helix transcriptional regulator n=1 Tax=Cryobacterium sp. Y11 TaxID=2045016 RepID=UPI001E474817|nr:helix-turn-helix domain-containing protein [Cryobacterium sp. Y11]
MGVSRQTINAIETGRYDPSLVLAVRLADTLIPPLKKCFTSQTNNRSPISTTNIVLVSTLFAGTIVAVLTQNWFGAILLLALGLFGLGAAV